MDKELTTKQREFLMEFKQLLLKYDAKIIAVAQPSAAIVGLLIGDEPILDIMDNPSVEISSNNLFGFD